MRANGFAERTIDTRIRHVRQLARGISIPPGDVDDDRLLEWCSRQTWKSETRHAYYTSIRLFFRFLEQETRKNPGKVLPRVRRPPGLPRPIPEPQLRDGVYWANERTQLILQLAAVIGLRAHEIAAVHRDDIDYDLLGLSLTVVGKGGRVRRLPLPKDLGRTLLRVTTANGGYAFPGKINGHLSPAWISKWAAKALPEKWTLHTLRHRFATRVYRQEHDLLILQRLLGHASVATTQRYAEPEDDSMRKAIEAACLTL